MLVERSVKAGTLHRDYPQLLARCRREGIPSYALTLLITHELQPKPGTEDLYPHLRPGFVRRPLPEKE